MWPSTTSAGRVWYPCNSKRFTGGIIRGSRVYTVFKNQGLVAEKQDQFWGGIMNNGFKGFRVKTPAIAVAAALAGLPAMVSASGFALIEQNASGLGNAYAGAAAAAEDASTIYFNPAGLTRLPGRQLVGAVHLIVPSAKFSPAGNNTSAFSTTGLAGPFAMNGNGGDAGEPAAVPNFYLSWQLDPKLFVGVGVNAPFGMMTDYDTNWMGRFHALKSAIETVNINPTVAYKVNEAFSMGLGLNWQRIDAELNKGINYSFLASAGSVPGVANNTEGSNSIKGNDSAWGFNFGFTFNPSPATTLGFSYRSAINYTLEGTVQYYARPAAIQGLLGVAAVANQAGDGAVSANVKMPASYSFAAKHKAGNWEFMADATKTEWSTIQTLNIVRSNGFLLESTPFNWRNTWRVGAGANYRYNSQWMVRTGIAFDETPTQDAFRTPRVPDQDRTWLSIGAQYRMSQQGVIDVGYAHIFVKDATINMNGAPALTSAQVAGRGSLIGSFNNKVDILSVQYRHNF